MAAPTIDFLKPKNFPLSVNECTAVALALMSAFLLYTILAGQTPLSLYIVALGLTGWFIFYYPEVGLLVALVSSMWFERFFTLAAIVINGIEYKLYPLDVILLFTGASILWHAYNQRLPIAHLVKRRALDRAIILFGVACCLGFGLSLIKTVDHALAFGTFKNYFLYAIIYLYAVLLLDTEASWQRLLNWLTIGGIGVLGFLAYGMASGHGLWTEYAPLSTEGTRLLAQSHAFFLFLFGIILTARFLWPKQAPRALSKDVIYFLWAAVALGIVVSLQRHLWLAGAVLVTIWLLVLPKVDRARLWHPLSRALAACAIGLFVALGAVVVWSGHLPLQAAHVVQVLRERTSLNLILNQEDSSARWRFAAWRAGLGLWVGQPIVGTGLGQEIFGYNQIYPFQVAARELHNDYLGILIQLGLVGLAAVVYWFVVIVRTMVSAWQRERTPLLFVSGSMLLLFFMIFGVSIYWDTNFFVMWWWLALAGLRFSSTDV